MLVRIDLLWKNILLDTINIVYGLTLMLRVERGIMNPIGISEELLYCTTRIVTDTSVGTGFIFSFPIENSEEVIPILITNKHVIDNDQYKVINLELHTQIDEMVQNESIAFEY